MEEKEAYSFASTLCSKQERCSSYVVEKLTKQQTSAQIISAVIERLKKERFLDDLRYATYYTLDKYRFEKWGRIKITYNLKIKQLPTDIINSALESIDEQLYLNNLNQILNSALKKSKETNEYKRNAKAAQLAASRGYETSLIYKTLNNPNLYQTDDE